MLTVTLINCVAKEMNENKSKWPLERMNERMIEEVNSRTRYKIEKTHKQALGRKKRSQRTTRKEAKSFTEMRNQRTTSDEAKSFTVMRNQRTTNNEAKSFTVTRAQKTTNEMIHRPQVDMKTLKHD